MSNDGWNQLPCSFIVGILGIASLNSIILIHLTFQKKGPFTSEYNQFKNIMWAEVLHACCEMAIENAYSILNDLTENSGR